MKNQKMYEADDKMISLIRDNYDLLQSLGSFGISLGFGDKTVQETCDDNHVDTYTFLAVVNYAINGYGSFDDDEQISVELSRLPSVYDKIVFVVNIYQAKQRRQHFGMIRNAYIRICDDKGVEMCGYNLSENYDNMTAMIFGEMFLDGSTWKFNAIGQPTTDNDLTELSSRFR